jgi:putative ABC transport system permease protein
MSGLTSDIKYSVRALRRRPGVVIYVVAILGLGIGANTAIFSVVSAALLERIPWADRDRIVSVRETNPEKQISDGPVSTADYLEWKDQADSFDLMSAFRFRYFNISGKDSPERVEGLETDTNFLPLVGVAPLMGRNFTAQEMEPGNDREAILTYRLWQRRFAGDPDILGRKADIEGTPYLIVGVLPSRFWMFRVLNHDIDLFVPLSIDPAGLSHESYDINLYGKLKPGITVEQAQFQLASIYSGLANKYPMTNAGWSVRVAPIIDWNGAARSSLILLLAAVALVLLIACANIAALLMARAASRARQMAIRIAVGASRSRLARQLLAESLILSTAGGAAGLGLAALCIDYLNNAIPYTMIRRVAGFHLDNRVLFFALAISTLTGVLFGLAPAFLSPKVDVLRALKDSGSQARVSPKSHRPMELLVIGEVALTVVLLASAALVIKGALRLQLRDRGLDPRNVLIMQLWLPKAKYAEGWQVSGFYRSLLEKAALVPGVQSASLVNFPPLDIISPDVGFVIEGRNSSLAEEQRRAEYKLVAPDYFRALRIPLIEGRCFTDADVNETNGVLMISRSLAKAISPGDSAIGKKLVLQFPRRKDLYWIPESRNLPLKIVGVVGDIDKEGLPGPHPGELYLPCMQNPSRFMHLILRTERDPLGLALAADKVVRSVDSDEPVFEVRTMDDVMSRSFSQSRMTSLLLGSFAGIALAIACLGIYGAASSRVADRTSEIGIRMALGAGRLDIFREIVGRSMLITAIGTLLGLFGTIAANRVIENALPQIISGDPSTPLLIACLTGLVSILAACLPARNATCVDPVEAIRCE